MLRFFSLKFRSLGGFLVESILTFFPMDAPMLMILAFTMLLVHVQAFCTTCGSLGRLRALPVRGHHSICPNPQPVLTYLDTGSAGRSQVRPVSSGSARDLACKRCRCTLPACSGWQPRHWRIHMQTGSSDRGGGNCSQRELRDVDWSTCPDCFGLYIS